MIQKPANRELCPVRCLFSRWISRIIVSKDRFYFNIKNNNSDIFRNIIINLH